jgi:hypothetical protein
MGDTLRTRANHISNNVAFESLAWGVRFCQVSAKKEKDGHGLGSPIIEDAKSCAVLGAYWPVLATDATLQQLVSRMVLHRFR